MRSLALPLALILALAPFSLTQQALAPSTPAVTHSAITTPAPVATPTPVVTPAPTPAAITPVLSADGKIMLREGVEVRLKFAEDLSSKTAAEGDPVTLLLDEDLLVGTVVVAKAGSKAFGEVTNAKKSGMMGKAGELNIRLNYLKVGDNKIRLRGTKNKEGQSGTTGAVVLTVLFGPIGLIKHGKNIDIKQGSALTAYVADDISVLQAN